MKYNANHIWTHNPARRVVSLFISVIWLATVLQPCVMASVVDSSSSNVETHQNNHVHDGQAQENDHSGHDNDRADAGNHGCPHCDTFGADEDQCGSEPSNTCDNDESYVYTERIKPADHEKTHGQHHPLIPLTESANPDHSGQLVAAEIGKSPPPFQTPKLTELYRVYLK